MNTEQNRRADLVPVPASSLPPADMHPARVYLMKLAPGSRPTMRGALQIAAELLSGGSCTWETMPWHALGPQHTNALRADLAARYAPTTANKMLAAVRGVLKACWMLDLITTDRLHRALAVGTVKGDTLPRGRALSQAELSALFSACRVANPESDQRKSTGKSAADSSRPAGARDAALLAVLYGSGLRRAEAVALDLADYSTENGSLTVRGGKGNKSRVSYLASGESSFIDKWLQFRGDAPGPLFCPVFKGGHVKIRRLDSRTVLDIVERRARVAGIEHFSPHDLRRTMISDLLDAGADIVTVQKLAGHANVQTTGRYDRRGEATRRKAARLLHVPGAD